MFTDTAKLTPAKPVRAATGAPVQANDTVSFWLLAYVALLPYQYAPTLHVRLGIADACLFFYLLFGFSRLRLRGEAWSVFHSALVVLFAVGLFVSASTTGSLTSYEYLNKGVGLLTLVASYVVVTSEVGNWWQLRKVVRAFVLGVSVQNAFALAALMASYLAGMKFSFVNYENERLSGFLYDPNAYGGLLVVALAFNMVGSGGPVPVTKGILRTLCNVTLVAGIGFTFSRTAWMAMAAAWLTCLVFRPKSALKMIGVLATAIPVILLFIGLGLISPRRMLDRPDTIETRVRLIDDSLAQFEKHPILGMGLGMFRETEGLIVHNTPLWFVVDFGLVGLGVFVGFIAWFYVTGARNYFAMPADVRPYLLGLLAGNSGMLGLSMGIEAFYQRHWWLCFALIGAAVTAARTAPWGFAVVSERPALRTMRMPAWGPAVATDGGIRT